MKKNNTPFISIVTPSYNQGNYIEETILSVKNQDYPNFEHIIIEPLEEFVPHLDKLVAKLNKAEYIIAAATSTSGNIVINVHPDLVGSSTYKEEEDSNVNGFERIVPAVTLDDIRRDRKTVGHT